MQIRRIGIRLYYMHYKESVFVKIEERIEIGIICAETWRIIPIICITKDSGQY